MLLPGLLPALSPSLRIWVNAGMDDSRIDGQMLPIRSPKPISGWRGAYLEVQDVMVKHLHAHGLRLRLLHQQPLVLVPGRAQRLLLVLLQSRQSLSGQLPTLAVHSDMQAGQCAFSI